MIRYSPLLLAAALLATALVAPAVAAALVAACVTAEVGARLYQAAASRRATAEPGALVTGVLDHGGELHRLDESVGLVPVPRADLKGRITIPGKPDRVYRVRTDAAGCRRTADDDGPSGRPVVAVFGCSWTFGAALNDRDTYPWLLQSAMPGFEVKNYGVGGHSLYQMLLRLEQTISRDRPVAVVVAYLPAHDVRNVGTLHRIPWFAAPSCRARGGSPACGDGLVRLPLRRAVRLVGWRYSRLIRAAGYVVNRLRAGGAGEDSLRRTTEALFLAIRKVSERAGAKLLVASLQHGNPHADFLTRLGFSWVGILPDVLLPGPEGDYPWLLLPYDSHPNEAANRVFADHIAEALARLHRGERVTPAPDYLRRNALAIEPPPAGLENVYPLY